jgi:hypothetical protein
MDLDQILAILARIGTDNPPSSSELTAAQTELSRMLLAEAQGNRSLDVMAPIRQAYDQAAAELQVAVAREAAEQQRIDDMIAGIEDPDAPPAEPETPETPEPIEVPEPLPAPEGPPPAGPGDPESQLAPPATPEVLPIAAQAIAAAGGAPRPMSLRDAAARVTFRQPTPEPIAAAGEAVNPTPGGQVFYMGRTDPMTVAPTIADVTAGCAAVTRSPSRGRHTVLSCLTDFSGQGIPMLPQSKGAVTTFLDEWTSPEAVAAAGGCCSLPTVIRTQTVINSTATPIQDSLPTIGVFESGSVLYYPAICLPSEGVWLWTCDDDENVDPEDPDTWKNCTFIECDDEARTNVEAIYKCLTIGEYKRRFATEQWFGILQATNALHARVSEMKLWTLMLEGTTHQCAQEATGSVFTNLVQAVEREAAWMRSDQRLREVELHFWITERIVSAIVSDFAARRLEFADPTIVKEMIARAFANANVVPHYTMDPDPMEAEGECGKYPDFMFGVLAPSGFYSYLDGGQFDLGVEIRDINLARQNAVAAFAEGFNGLLARGCRSKVISIPVEVCHEAAGACTGS